MPRHLDLDAVRAARREEAGPAPSVTFDGRDWKLRPELSIEAAAAWHEQDAARFVAAILADPTEVDQFLAIGELNWSDLLGLIKAYGADPGESPAS